MKKRLVETLSIIGCGFQGHSVCCCALPAIVFRYCRRGALSPALILVGSLVGSLAWAQDAGQSSAAATRMEKDLLGEKAIPASAYYGVQTARTLENFQLSGVLINHYPGFVEAWAIVKLAAARANADVGAMKRHG